MAAGWILLRQNGHALPLRAESPIAAIPKTTIVNMEANSPPENVAKEEAMSSTIAVPTYIANFMPVPALRMTAEAIGKAKNIRNISSSASTQYAPRAAVFQFLLCASLELVRGNCPNRIFSASCTCCSATCQTVCTALVPATTSGLTCALAAADFSEAPCITGQ